MEKQEFRKGFVVGIITGALGALLIYKNRREITSRFWRFKARADLQRRLNNLRKITKKDYDDLVDQVVDKYRNIKDLSEVEIDEFAVQLKERWSEVKERIEGTMADRD